MTSAAEMTSRKDFEGIIQAEKGGRQRSSERTNVKARPAKPGAQAESSIILSENKRMRILCENGHSINGTGILTIEILQGCRWRYEGKTIALIEGPRLANVTSTKQAAALTMQSRRIVLLGKVKGGKLSGRIKGKVKVSVENIVVVPEIKSAVRSVKPKGGAIELRKRKGGTKKYFVAKKTNMN